MMPKAAVPTTRALVPIGVLIGYFVIAYGAIAIARGSALVSPIWLANAAALVIALRWGRSRAELAAILGAAVLAAFAANMLGGSKLIDGVVLSLLNGVEIGCALVFVRRFATTRFRTVAQGWRFFLFAGPLPSCVAALGVYLLASSEHRGDALMSSLTWASADVLGLVLIGPFAMTVSIRELAKLDLRRRWGEAAGIYLLLTAATLCVFAQSQLPLLFVVAPFIILATFQFGLSGAAAALLLVAAIAVPMTANGTGPISLVRLPSLGLKLMTLQLFLALNGLTAAPLAAALTQRANLLRGLRRRELELQHAARISELADEVAHAGHWTLNLATGDRSWSLGVFAILGFPVTPVPPDLSVALSLYAEDEREAVRRTLAEAAAERRGLEMEHTLVRPDGVRRRVRTRAHFVGDEGDGCMVGVVRDVTEDWEARQALAASERRYRTVVTAVNDYAIYMLDAEGNVASWNAGAEAIKGYAAEILGRHVSCFYTEEDRAVGAPEAALKAALAKGRFATEGWRVRKDGSRLRASVVIEPIFEDGRLTGYVKITRDITAQYEADIALKAALAEANAANVAKADFLANMSHEIRTPLHSIVGFSRLLSQAEELTPEHRRQAEITHSASRSLVQIVDDILDFSKFEAEGVSLALEPVDLATLIEDAADLVRDAASAKGVRVEVCSEGAVGRVLADPLRLRQVLLNLLGNAVKFTAAGMIAIRIEEAGGRVRIAVTDTGIGIAADRLGAVFDRFAQADASTSRRFGGTGLGLAICRSIVHSMGGEIGVDSVEGQGSTFWFAFTPEPAPALALSPRSPAADASLRGLRVLLADDSEPNRELFGALMAGLGLDITYAIDGADAVQAVMRQRFDVVLMDMQMPVMDGLEATRAIRGAGFDRLPIVALTANVMQAQIDLCIAAGMNGHLPKPYTAVAVQAVLAHWGGPVAALPAPTPGAMQENALADIAASIGAEQTERFLDELVAQLRDMQGRLAAPAEPGVLAREAHAVRGFAATLGFAEIAEAYQALEVACLGESDLAPKLRAALAATDAGLKQLENRKAA